jgi:dTDP-4-amino-4,6-dideoxygalactose transaminase
VSRIPFNRPYVGARELAHVREAIGRGHLSSNGRFTEMCEELLKDVLGCQRVLLTSSCTHALELAALLLRIEPGDEVIVPSFTYVSTVNAFVNYGARPVFVDVRADTLDLDESLIEARIGPRTRALVPVHYAGVGCEMDALGEIARRRGLVMVEDNAHGLFGRYRGRMLGTLGALATQSFHETKNLTCGEGGALVINDPSLIARAEILRDKGTDRARFFRGQVDRYTWVDLGSSWGLSEVLAAFLFAQLEERERIGATRRQIWERYHRALTGWAQQRGWRGPTVPAHCEQTFHMYYLLLPSPQLRQALIEHLARRDILAIFHYQPLHLSQMGERFGGRRGDCPVTESVSDRLLRLPLYHDLSPDDQDRVIDAVREFGA